MKIHSQDPKVHLRRWSSAGCAVLACAALAACGSSSKSSSSGGASGSSTASGATTSGGATTSAGATTSSSGASPAIAAAAKAYQSYLNPVTKINISTPLKSPAPRGKTLVVLGTSNPQNVEIQQQFAAIAKTYGWNESAIQYDPANTQAFGQALNTAIQKHANFINESGTPLTPSVISQIQKSGAKLIPIGVYPITIKPPIIGDPDSFANDATLAQPIADYFISNSQGKGNALVVHVPAYSILDGFTDTLNKIVKAKCPGCTLKYLDLTLPQIANGQENSAVTAALRSDPSAKYLIYDDGGWADGIPSSLAAAGLSGKVQIIGQAPNQDEFAQTRAGKEVLWSGFNAPETAMQAFDVMFRNLEGMPIPKADLTQNTQAITKANVGSATEFLEPSNALQQYEALWNK